MPLSLLVHLCGLLVGRGRKWLSDWETVGTDHFLMRVQLDSGELVCRKLAASFGGNVQRKLLEEVAIEASQLA